jgi:hypothetical protein
MRLFWQIAQLGLAVFKKLHLEAQMLDQWNVGAKAFLHGMLS